MDFWSIFAIQDRVWIPGFNEEEEEEEDEEELECSRACVTPA